MTAPIYLDMFPEDLDAAPGKGYLNAQYGIVGIAPSPNRPLHRLNEPFGAKSYEVLKMLLDVVGEENVYTTNLIKKPVQPGTKPAKYELQYYYPILLDELRHIGITGRILALGNPVAEVLCPGFQGMRNDHGVMFLNPDLNLYVMPTYHFSAIGRDPSLMPVLRRDIERFFQLGNPEEPDYIEIPNTVLDFTRYFEAKLAPRLEEGQELVIDIETKANALGDGLNLMADIISFGLQPAWSEVPYLCIKPEPAIFPELMKLLRRSKVKLVGHNLAFDLARLVYQSKVTWMHPVEDTLLLAHVRGEPQLGLKHLTTMHTDRAGSHAFGGFENPAYLAEDVLSTRELLHKFQSNGRPRTPIADLLGRLVPVFAAMEVRGVYVDRSRLAELRQESEALIDAAYAGLHESVFAATGQAVSMINWNSSPQVVKVLQACGVPLTKTTDTGAFSANEAVLLGLREQHPVVHNLLNHREAIKYRGFIEDYLMRTDSEPYLHPSVRLFGAETGRLSMREPNLQQVTRTGPLKQIFVNRDPNGKMGLCDLAQAELRVAALLSGDEALAAALRDGDVHTNIASVVFKLPIDQVPPRLRKKSKGVTFGLLYGGSEKGLAERVGVPISEVHEVVEGFYGAFPDLAKWLAQMGEFGVNNRYITTPMGRFRSLEQLYQMEGPRSVRRKAVNTPIQGTASDLMLLVLDQFAKHLMRYKLKTRPLFPVHDSLIMEIAPGEEEAVVDVLRKSFEGMGESPLSQFPLWHELPITGDLNIGPSWSHIDSTNENYGPESSHAMSSLGVTSGVSIA